MSAEPEEAQGDPGGCFDFWMTWIPVAIVVGLVSVLVMAGIREGLPREPVPPPRKEAPRPFFWERLPKPRLDAVERDGSETPEGIVVPGGLRTLTFSGSLWRLHKHKPKGLEIALGLMDYLRDHPKLLVRFLGAYEPPPGEDSGMYRASLHHPIHTTQPHILMSRHALENPRLLLDPPRLVELEREVPTVSLDDLLALGEERSVEGHPRTTSTSSGEGATSADD